MTSKQSPWSRAAAHVLALSTILVLWLIAWSTFNQGGKGRDWWWFSGNDACQGFAAQSISMRLGAPIQTVVWPGATLGMPYLYASLVKPSPASTSLVPGVTEALLSDAVQFHWAQAAIFGLLLLGLMYGLCCTWTRSPLIALVVTGLVATNEWYLFGLFHVRAEIPSLVFALAACAWATRDRARTRPIARPVVFGALIALALLSKIQIAPVFPLCAYLYFRKASESSADAAIHAPRPVIASFVLLGMLGLAAMIRTSAIDGGTYGLGGLPSTFAHALAAVLAVLLLMAACVTFMTTPRLASLGRSFVLMAGGATIALAGLVVPVLLHGGFKAAAITANRIMFGTATFARYGLQLEAEGGWGLKGSIADRAVSVVEFQSTSGLPVTNLVLAASVLIAGCLLLLIVLRSLPVPCRASNSDMAIQEAKPWMLSIAMLFTAIAMDLAMTQRVVSTTTYSFYHIYSIPFYLLALACAAGAIRDGLPERLLRAPQMLACTMAAMLAAGVWLVGAELSTGRMKLWQKPISAPEEYFKDENSTSVIWGVAPDFGRLTGQSYAGLRDFVIARDKAKREAKDIKAAPK
jgi:hypothetical protein